MWPAAVRMASVRVPARSPATVRWNRRREFTGGSTYEGAVAEGWFGVWASGTRVTVATRWATCEVRLWQRRQPSCSHCRWEVGQRPEARGQRSGAWGGWVLCGAHSQGLGLWV